MHLQSGSRGQPTLHVALAELKGHLRKAWESLLNSATMKYYLGPNPEVLTCFAKFELEANNEPGSQARSSTLIILVYKER